MDIFHGLVFPYSCELKDIPLETRPNVQISNLNQSFYLVLKNIRAELIEPKLRSSDSLLLDKFVQGVLNVPVNVKELYPPENMSKLESLITKLQENDIDAMGMDCVLYYILKDFDLVKAEHFIRGGSDSLMGYSRVSMRIPKCLYDLINGLYYLDRLNILKCVRYLNSIDDFSNLPSGILDHLVKLSNIVPYHSQDVNIGTHLIELKNYIDVQSCKSSARSVVSVVRSLKRPVWILHMDLQLLYWDCITDLNPGLSVRKCEETRGNYSNDISWEMTLKLVVVKLLIKTVKQQRLLKKLLDSGKITNIQFDRLYEEVAMFALVDTKIDQPIETTLVDVLANEISTDEAELRLRYPKYFQKLDEHHQDYVRTARNLLLWKYSLENKLDKVQQLTQGIPQLQEIATYIP